MRTRAATMCQIAFMRGQAAYAAMGLFLLFASGCASVPKIAAGSIETGHALETIRAENHRRTICVRQPAGQELHFMDKNRNKGAEHEIKGALKELAGKITGNDSKQLAGKVEQKLGKIQRKAGEASDEIRDAAKKDD